MTAVKAGDVDRAVRSRPAGIALLLFYGPDQGRVAERARAAAVAFVADPSDAFQLIRMDGDLLADEPARLAEEAATFGLFGGKRALWVRPTSRTIAPAVAACLEVPMTDTLVVIEAGDLSKGAPLRSLCEASPQAYALPCYADESRDLATVVTETLQTEGLAIERDARDVLVEHLGGDRLASRGELEKLALYCRGAGTVTLADVEAAVSDVSGHSVDAVVDTAFGGDVAGVESGLVGGTRAGVTTGTLLALASRHAWLLLGARHRFDEGGQDMESALRNWRGLHFRRRDAITRQIRRWTQDDLRRAVAILQEVTSRSRLSAGLADTLAADALLRIARRGSP